MRTKVCILFVFTSFFFVSCQQEDFLKEIPISDQNNIESVVKEDISEQEFHERQQLGVNCLSSQAAQSALGLF